MKSCPKLKRRFNQTVRLIFWSIIDITLKPDLATTFERFNTSDGDQEKLGVERETNWCYFLHITRLTGGQLERGGSDEDCKAGHQNFVITRHRLRM